MSKWTISISWSRFSSNIRFGRRKEGCKEKATTTFNKLLHPAESQQAMDNLRVMNTEGTFFSLIMIALGDSDVRMAIRGGILCQALPQLLGIDVIMLYTSKLFGTSSSIDLLGISYVTSYLQLAGCLVAMCCVDYVGRKTGLLTGLVSVTCGLAMMFIVFLGDVLAKYFQIKNFVWFLAPVGFVDYLLGFYICLCVIPYILNVEAYPPRHRGFCSGVVTSVHFVAKWIIPLFLLFLNTAKGGHFIVFALFIIFDVIALFNTLKVVRETAGRDLETAMEHQD